MYASGIKTDAARMDGVWEVWEYSAYRRVRRPYRMSPGW